jgi:hemin uptake protein HemP
MPGSEQDAARKSEETLPSNARPRRLKVSEILAGNREVILEHGGQDYRLRITANDKLILTK